MIIQAWKKVLRYPRPSLSLRTVCTQSMLSVRPLLHLLVDGCGWVPWTVHTKKATDQCTERKQRTHTAHYSLWSGQRDSVPISGKQSTDLIVIQVNPSLVLIQCFRGPQQQHQQHQGRIVLQHKPTRALFSFGNRTPNTHSSCAATQITVYSVLVDKAFHPKHKVCS